MDSLAKPFPIVARKTFEVSQTSKVSSSRARWISKHRGLSIGIAFALVLAAISILAPFLAPYDPAQQNLENSLMLPNAAHWLGTDALGRDLLSRVMWRDTFR